MLCLYQSAILPLPNRAPDRPRSAILPLPYRSPNRVPDRPGVGWGRIAGRYLFVCILILHI